MTDQETIADLKKQLGQAKDDAELAKMQFEMLVSSKPTWGSNISSAVDYVTTNKVKLITFATALASFIGVFYNRFDPPVSPHDPAAIKQAVEKEVKDSPREIVVNVPPPVIAPTPDRVPSVLPNPSAKPTEKKA